MSEYISINMKDIERHIQFPFPVQMFGQQTRAPYRTQNYCYSDRFEFSLRISATREYAVDILDGVEYRTPYPHLIIKKPGVCHINLIHDQRNSFFVIYADHLLSKFQECGIQTEPPILPVNLTPSISTTMQVLKELFKKSHDFGIAETIDVLCFRFVTELMLSSSNVNRMGERYEERMIRNAASYLQLHFADPIEVRDLIEMTNLPNRTFFRYWKKIYHKTPLQYLLSQKLLAAERLLRETDLPVYSIASSLGFEDSSYFIRQFKKKYGKTPLRLRNSYIQ